MSWDRTEAAEDALDALELMVTQYLYQSRPGQFDHAFMAAGEYASVVLAEHRPERWAQIPTGVARRDVPAP